MAAETRFARLAESATFAGSDHARFLDTRVILIGAGVLGSRLAQELALAGARVEIVDPADGREENLGTQLVRAGEPKARSVAAACEARRPSSARAHVADVRALGIGFFVGADVLLNASDDPELESALAEISTGLALPSVRVALDGSGASELFRVTVTHGGGGHACALCSFTPRDLASSARTPCPQRPLVAPERAPTRASGALAAMAAGLGALTVMKLAAGSAAELLGTETVGDPGRTLLRRFRLPRSEHCLSGHVRFELELLDRLPDETSLAELFAAAGERLGGAAVLEPHLTPLATLAACACGWNGRATGTRWSEAPRCPRCGESGFWRPEGFVPRLDVQLARTLGLLDFDLATLGFTRPGALFIARRDGARPACLVLDRPASTSPS